MTAVTPNNIGGTTSAANNPSFSLANHPAIGDFLLVLVVQATGVEPDAPSDSLSTPYRRLAGGSSPDGTLGYCLYGGITTASGKCTVSCPTSAPSACGARGYSGVALDSRGRVEGVSAGAGSPATIFNADGQTASIGDLIMAIVVAAGNVPFTVDPSTSGSWTDVRATTGNRVSFDLQECSPNPPGYANLVWTTTAPVTALTASVVLAHS